MGKKVVGSVRWVLDTSSFLVAPGSAAGLSDRDPNSKEGFDGGKAEGKAALKPLNSRLAELQTALWAESTQKLPPEMANAPRPGAADTQRLPQGAQSTQRLPATDPSSTQKLPTDTMRLSGNVPAKPEPGSEPTITLKDPKLP